jgi:hypothetical protein
VIDVEPLITESFDRIFPQPVAEEDWEGVLRRAGLHGRRSRRRLLALVAAGLAVAAATTAFAYHYLAPSPGFSAGLSSLNNLPPVPWPSSLPRTALDHAAAATGLSPEQAAQRLRLVQTGLSLGHAKGISLYAFQGKDPRTGCVLITGPDSGVICTPTWMPDNPALDGIAYADGGGSSPQAPGPLALWGLVADNINGVETNVGGVSHSIPIVNNSFYADYDRITSTNPITLIIHFADGTTRTFHLPNPYGG